MTTDLFDLLDVVHIPEEAGQRAPRHQLMPQVVVAPCRVCNRTVIRWSLMGPGARAALAEEIRTAMERVS